MINGAHVDQSPTAAEAGRAFLADVAALPLADVGHARPILGPPPAEHRPGLFSMCQGVPGMAARERERRADGSAI